MKRQSSKAARQNRERAQLRVELLASRGPMCEKCHEEPWSDMHEVLSRGRGGSPTDPDNIRCLCRGCHHFITVNPAWAEENGWARSRTAEEHQKTFRPWEDTP